MSEHTPGVDCHRCDGPVNNPPDSRKYIYCQKCREVIGMEKIREEVGRMDWPDEIG